MNIFRIKSVKIIRSIKDIKVDPLSTRQGDSQDGYKVTRKVSLWEPETPAKIINPSPL